MPNINPQFYFRYHDNLPRLKIYIFLYFFKYPATCSAFYIKENKAYCALPKKFFLYLKNS